MGALGLTEPPGRGSHRACYATGRHVPALVDDDSQEPPHEPLLESVHALVADEEDELAVDGAELVHRLRLLTFSASHPGIADGRVLTPEEIVDTVLYGLARRTNPLTLTPRQSLPSSCDTPLRKAPTC
jgi:hypothetical protein